MVTRQNTNGIVPERIREARLARGYSLTELATLIGDVSKQAISQYELGSTVPGADKIEKLVEILEVPYDFFYNPIQHSLSDPIFFRQYKTALDKERSMAQCRLKWMTEILLYLERFFDFIEAKTIIKTTPKTYSNEEIESIAVEVRQSWGLGLGPISDVCLLLENNGFIISKAILGKKKMDACSTNYNNRPLQFLTADKSSAVRSRFDAVHELGHKVLHQSWVDYEYLDNKENHERIEKEAHHFAGAFLMPQEPFTREVYSVSIDSLIHLKKRWKVSIAMMMRRGYDLGIFSKNQYEYLQRQRSERGYKLYEPLDDEIPDEKPKVLNKAINMLIDHKVQSVEQILDSLKLPVKEIEMLCNLPEGSLGVEKKIPTLRLIKSSN